MTQPNLSLPLLAAWGFRTALLRPPWLALRPAIPGTWLDWAALTLDKSQRVHFSGVIRRFCLFMARQDSHFLGEGQAKADAGAQS